MNKISKTFRSKFSTQLCALQRTKILFCEQPFFKSTIVASSKERMGSHLLFQKILNSQILRDQQDLAMCWHFTVNLLVHADFQNFFLVTISDLGIQQSLPRSLFQGKCPTKHAHLHCFAETQVDDCLHMDGALLSGV